MTTENTATATEATPAKPKRLENNGISRPNAGSKTGRIWEIADALSSQTNQPATRKDVLAQAEVEEINKSTATTQYGQWRKYHGLDKEAKEAKAAVAAVAAVAPVAAVAAAIPATPAALAELNDELEAGTEMDDDDELTSLLGADSHATDDGFGE